ncbi:MAG: YbjN domain-containing protein [Acidobacteriota bacterium]
MATLLDEIIGYFERDGWKYRQLGSHAALEMGVAGEHGTYRLVAIVDGERSIVRFLTFIEGRVPESRRREIMEYFTRANYGLLLGNFELDLGDGEVRFKCSQSVEGDHLSYEQYQHLLYISVAMVDRYFPGLQRVLQGTADAAAAIADTEQ